MSIVLTGKLNRRNVALSSIRVCQDSGCKRTESLAVDRTLESTHHRLVVASGCESSRRSQIRHYMTNLFIYHHIYIIFIKFSNAYKHVSSLLPS